MPRRRPSAKPVEQPRPAIPTETASGSELEGRYRTLYDFIPHIVAMLLLGVLAYSVQSVMSPFMIAAAILFLLSPFRRHPVSRRIMQLTVLLLASWVVYSLLPILAPFIAAYLLAYILNPLVSALERRSIPRWLSSLVVVLLLISGVVLVLIFVLPIVITQFQGLTAGVRTLIQDLRNTLASDRVFAFLQAYGVSPQQVRDAISSQLTPRLEQIITSLFEGVFGVISRISSVAMQVINAIIIPFLTFYLLMDFRDVGARFYRFFPERQRDYVRNLISRIDAIMGRYLRGAIVVAAIQGLISMSALALIGVRFALVLGIMTAILNFIPYLGLITSLVVAVIVALFSGEPVVVKVLAVILLYLSQKLLEATVLGPKIIGAQVGLHPVVLILCLLVFGYFLGFVGLLIAVPATAFLLALVKEWEERRAEVA